MKEQCEEEELSSRSDGLSELPDSLILHILGLLPTADAIRTTILSKRWRNLWTTIPFLEFNDCTKKFVDGAVNSWRGIKLSRYKLEVHSQSMEVDEWVQFAVEKKVEELELELVLAYPHILSWAMHHVCSCSSLKKLTLYGYYDDEIHGNVQWVQLKELRIIRLGVLLMLCRRLQLREKLTISPFPNANDLRLRVCYEEYEQIIGVVEMFPQLRELYLETTYKTVAKAALSLKEISLARFCYI